jgi:hypothetical protein
VAERRFPPEVALRVDFHVFFAAFIASPRRVLGERFFMARYVVITCSFHFFIAGFMAILIYLLIGDNNIFEEVAI